MSGLVKIYGDILLFRHRDQMRLWRVWGAGDMLTDVDAELGSTVGRDDSCQSQTGAVRDHVRRLAGESRAARWLPCPSQPLGTPVSIGRCAAPTSRNVTTSMVPALAAGAAWLCVTLPNVRPSPGSRFRVPAGDGRALRCPADRVRFASEAKDVVDGPNPLGARPEVFGRSLVPWHRCSPH